jgi:2-keto-4-pentenoate hydratase
VPDSPADRQALIDALRDMSVVVTEGDGATLAQGRGADLLGHPLNAVIWLASALAQEELALKAGDLISLGSFTALLAPRAGQSVTVTYKGLAGAEPVKVTFK